MAFINKNQPQVRTLDKALSAKSIIKESCRTYSIQGINLAFMRQNLQLKPTSLSPRKIYADKKKQLRSSSFSIRELRFKKPVQKENQLDGRKSVGQYLKMMKKAKQRSNQKETSYFDFQQYKVANLIKEQMKLELKQQTINALNIQYKCDTFWSPMTLIQIVKSAEAAMKNNIDIIDYELTGWQIQKYGIRLNPCEKQPFLPAEYKQISQLITICSSLMNEFGESSQVKMNALLNQLTKFVINGHRTLQISEHYHKYMLFFKRISFKDAIIFEVLNKCQIFYTIFRERKKSGKAFFLDPLIQAFEEIQRKLNITHPFHENVLPKKQLRFFERKITDKKMKNLLFDAISNCNYKEVRELLAKGHSLSQPGICERQQMREMYCQHRACQIADLQMCRILHSYQPSWEVTDKQGMTPLHFAVQSGKLQLIQFLIEEVKVQLQPKDIQNRTPFYFACTEGDLPIIRYLYSKGADINNKSKLGRSALSKACYLGLVDVVTFLLNCSGIEITIEDGKGRTALHNAVFGPKGGREGHKFGTNQKDSPQCTQLLLQNGFFDVDYMDKEKNTPLHVAMSSDGRDSIRILLAFGASLTKINCYGETPLLTGAKFGHIQAVRMLKEQYGASLVVKDIFDKNLMLLCAKFRQNDGKEINEVFYYSTNQLLLMAKEQKKELQLKEQKGEVLKDWSQQIDYTFRQLLKQKKRVQEEFFYFCAKLIEYQLCIRHFRIEDFKMLLQSFKSEDMRFAEIAQYLVEKSAPFSLNIQEYRLFVKWILLQNNTGLLQFVLKIEKKLINYILLENKLTMTLTGMLSEILFESLYELKEKMLTFCLLRINIDWVRYSDVALGSNLIHQLVKFKKIGTLIQVLKVLSGTNLVYPTNSYLVPLLQQYTKIDQKQTSLLWRELRRLLRHKNKEGLDAYSLALLLKDAAAAKLIEEKLKILQEHIEKKSSQDNVELQVKEYKVRLEDQETKIQIFNKGFDLEKQLQEMQFEIQNSSEKALEMNFSVLRELPTDINKDVNIDDFQTIWKESYTRQLIYIKKVEEIEALSSLNQQSIIGIDIEYFYAAGNTLISIMQISSLTQDFIVDFLFSAHSHKTNNQFKEKLAQVLKPIASNKKIMKVMHGSDNDLCVIKSFLNISFLNFLDTARLQLEISKQQNIRGLATLLHQYLKQHMPKDYQVSEWRIRPIPSSMLEYARRDSMVLPFLARKLLNLVQKKKLKIVLIAGCRQARKNKKPNQLLICSIQAL